MASIEEALKKTKEEKTLQILERYFNFKKDFIDSITLTEEIYNLFVGAYNAETKEYLKQEIKQRILQTQKIANDFFSAFWDFKNQADSLKKVITHLKEANILETNKKLQAPFQSSQELWGNKRIQNEDAIQSKLTQQKTSFQHIISLSDLDFENYKDFFKHDHKLFQRLIMQLQDYIIFQSFDDDIQKLKQNSNDLKSITTWLETYTQIKDELPKTQAEYNTLKENTVNLYQEIELLREGVISAGLAKTYAEEGEKNNSAKKKWTITAIVGIFLLAILANFHSEIFPNPSVPVINQIKETASFSKAFIHFLSIAPIYFATIWLILFASRRRNETNRLASDYAHKAVFASSYIVCRDEIKKLKELHPQKAEDLTELNIKLLDSMIGVLSDNPAKSLDTKKTTDELPAKELVNFASEVIKLKGK